MSAEMHLPYSTAPVDWAGLNQPNLENTEKYIDKYIRIFCHLY